MNSFIVFSSKGCLGLLAGRHNLVVLLAVDISLVFYPERKVIRELKTKHAVVLPLRTKRRLDADVIYEEIVYTFLVESHLHRDVAGESDRAGHPCQG
jgi:hypothetical protein